MTIESFHMNCYIFILTLKCSHIGCTYRLQLLTYFCLPDGLDSVQIENFQGTLLPNLLLKSATLYFFKGTSDFAIFNTKRKEKHSRKGPYNTQLQRAMSIYYNKVGTQAHDN